MIEQKILAVKIKEKGELEYLRRPQVKQYENKATVIWAWFTEVELGESITVKLHYRNADGETLIDEQFFIPFVTTEDLINDIPDTPNFGQVVIPSGTKVYTYEIPQGLTAINGQLEYNIVAYLDDDSIVLSQNDKIKIWSATPPSGTFIPDVIDPTLEALLASKTDLVDFNALRNGSLGFTLIDLDGHSLTWSDLIGTAQLEMLNGVVQDIGLEVLKYGRASGSIADGTPAQFVKYLGQRPIFKTPVASEVNDNPHNVRVLATQDFTNNQDGYFTRFGSVRNINTMGYLLPGEDANDETTWGDTRLWYDPVTNGLTRTRPSSPNAKISMGYVTKFHSTQGVIDTDVIVYPKLTELQDVMNGATDGQVWVYDSALGLTKPSSRLSDAETHLSNLQTEVDNLELVGGIVINEATDKENDVLIRREKSIFLTTADYDNNTGAEFFIETQNTADKEGFAQVYVLDGVSGVGASLSLDGGDGSIDLQGDGDMWVSGETVYINANSPDATHGITLFANESLPLQRSSVDVTPSEIVLMYDNNTPFEAGYHYSNKRYSSVKLNETSADLSFGRPEYTIYPTVYPEIAAKISAHETGIDVYSERGNIDIDANTSNVTLTGVEVQVNGTLNVVGDIVQNGAAYETHAEQIYTEKDHIILRDGAVAGLTAGTYAGLITKLADGTNDAFFGYNGDGIARVGDITYVGGVPDFSGTQALATRQDSPTSNGVAYWNSTDKRFDTDAGLSYAPSTDTLITTYLVGTLSNINGIDTARVQPSSTGTTISRNIADSNPALKVNLANASSTGNIAEFQKAGTNKVAVDKDGIVRFYGTGLGLSNEGYNNSHLLMNTTGILAERNINDSNPALTVNEQQGTGDILRLQYGGATKSVFNKDGYLGINKTTATLPLDVNGNARITGNLEVTGDIIATKSAVDYTKTYSNTISSTFGDVVAYKDGTPLITEISGRTMPVIPQLVTNGDFSDGTTGWTSVASTNTVSGGIATNTSNGTSTAPSINLSTFTLTQNVKYYSITRLRTTSSLTTSFVFYTFTNANKSYIPTITSPVQNTWYIQSGIYTPIESNATNTRIIHAYTTALEGNNKSIEVDYFYSFNLSTLISNKQYSPLYNKTFDLMSDAEIKAQMDLWVQTNQVPTSVVQHAENTTIKATGKNLFDKSQSTNNRPILSATGLPTPYEEPGLYSSDFIKIKPSTQYVQSHAVGGSGIYNSCFYDINKNFISSFPLGSSTATSPANAFYIRTTGRTSLTVVDSFQLEQGSTATTYAPYKSETQVFTHGRLSRLPNNVSDKIRYDNGKYVLDRYVQEYTLQASDITLSTTLTNIDFIAISAISGMVASTYPAQQNHIIENFISYSGSITDFNSTDLVGYSIHSAWWGQDIYLIIPKGTYANLTAAQSALAGTKIYYQLATPLLATEVIDVDGTLVQDSVTTLEQLQTLATEYDVKFAINSEQTVINLVDRDKIQQEELDTIETKIAPLDEGGTLLASDSSNGIFSVSALSNYKFIEVRASTDGMRFSSNKLPSSCYIYVLGNSAGCGMLVAGVDKSTPTTFHIPATLTIAPANAGKTQIEVDGDMSNYDIYWEVYGWNY